MIGTAMLRPPLYGLHVPTHYASLIDPILLIAKLYLGVLLFFITYRGTHPAEDGWLDGRNGCRPRLRRELSA